MNGARLYERSALGPCAASVLLEAVELASGAVRFRLTERWTPPIEHRLFGDAQAAIGEIMEVTLVDDERQARRLAKAYERAWREGSARSDELAPGGRLRANGGRRTELPL